jgi:chromosome segregation ATPase
MNKRILRMSSKKPSQISVKDIKISSDRIEVLGQVNGIPIYVRPNWHGGFKKVGTVMPGRYLAEHGAAFVDIVRKDREVSMRNCRMAERERDVVLKSCQEHAQARATAENQLKQAHLQIQHLENLNADLQQRRDKLNEELTSRIRHLNAEVERLETRLQGEAEARMKDHQLVTSALNKSETYNAQLNDLLAESKQRTEGTRELLKDTLQLGARLAQELLS